eukprot:GGOE01040704.1.p2 GENE.GGOE01040704.1~~GGOE01040704.1.p2  ORF type:complete len:141 (-),score=7.64 GGOE01040704.1:122-544(-)
MAKSSPSITSGGFPSLFELHLVHPGKPGEREHMSPSPSLGSSEPGILASSLSFSPTGATSIIFSYSDAVIVALFVVVSFWVFHFCITTGWWWTVLVLVVWGSRSVAIYHTPSISTIFKNATENFGSYCWSSSIPSTTSVF